MRNNYNEYSNIYGRTHLLISGNTCEPDHPLRFTSYAVRHTALSRLNDFVYIDEMNFIVILMIYFGSRCHTSSEPTHSNLSNTFSLRLYVFFFVSVTIIRIRAVVVVVVAATFLLRYNQMIVNHVAGDDMRSLISSTYNQLHIDRAYYQLLFWLGEKMSTTEWERARAATHSLFQSW